MSEKKHRIVPILYDEKGLPTGASFLSPVDDTNRAICVVPPNEVLPVLFIPGIMGSNLKLNTPIKDFNNGKDICWRPDSAIYTAWTFANLDPGERRAILNPDNTAVDDRAEIPDSKLPVFKTTDKATRANWKKEFARRGWGTVMLGSYGEILYALELNLNTIYSENFELDSYWQDSILSVKSKSDAEEKSHGWGDLTGFEALTETDLKEKVGDKYWFPVHAAGYNWLRSNEEAGKDIAKRIKSIISHYQGLGYPCKKVIIVTHSMGGLAARAACHPEMGNAQEMVAGVIHGEQPAVGAAAAYKRMHAGFEAGLNPINAIVARALGWSGKEVTSTLSNAPGGLELLPTKLYPTGWLKVQIGSDVAMELPLADPYAEIYSEQVKWWRLMTSEWINPSAYNVSPEALGSIWNNYLTRLEIADNFHNKLGAYYHPVTHAHYGADEEQKAWTTITWKSGDASSSKSAEFEHENSLDKFKNKLDSASKLKNVSNANVLAASIEHENALGKIKINLGEVNLTFHISRPDKPGDGTVPEISGAASASKAKFAAKMSGYDHQGSYQDQRVKDVTIYSVARIAKSI